jgi:hypothetical protein
VARAVCEVGRPRKLRGGVCPIASAGAVISGTGHVVVPAAAHSFMRSLNKDVRATTGRK